MFFDPIGYIILVKQCTSDSQNKQSLIDWLNLANLLSMQSHGCAISAQLIDVLEALFNPTMAAIAALDAIPENREPCQLIYAQTSEFYQWLDGLSGESVACLEHNWACWSAQNAGNESNDNVMQLTESSQTGTDNTVAETGKVALNSSAVIVSPKTSPVPESTSDSQRQYNKYD